jgi:hypothetical protein
LGPGRAGHIDYIISRVAPVIALIRRRGEVVGSISFAKDFYVDIDPKGCLRTTRRRGTPFASPLIWREVAASYAL